MVGGILVLPGQSHAQWAGFTESRVKGWGQEEIRGGVGGRGVASHLEVQAGWHRWAEQIVFFLFATFFFRPCSKSPGLIGFVTGLQLVCALSSGLAESAETGLSDLQEFNSGLDEMTI